MSGQYVAYRFFRVDPSWRRLPVEERAAGKDAFAEVVEDWAGRMDSLRAYTVTGVRPETWLNSGANVECRCWLPFLAKLPVKIHSSLFR